MIGGVAAACVTIITCVFAAGRHYERQSINGDILDAARDAKQERERINEMDDDWLADFLSGLRSD